MIYRRAALPVLARLDPERAHHLALTSLGALSRLARPVQRRSEQAESRGGTTVFGVRFPARVGAAAGLDKDGRALRAWPLLGFGFVEVGTVTAQAQPGNPRPRLFRLRADEAIVNRMGFNNAGSAALAVRLHRMGPLPVPLGVSLGKSKVTPMEAAIGDYLTSLRLLHGYSDYIAVNVSSPNTPGLRALQDRAALTDLVDALVRESQALAGSGRSPAPLLVKVAPDLTNDALGELVDVCLGHGVSGLVATNTTLDRGSLRHPDPRAREAGGLSGPPLLGRSLEVVRRISAQAGDRLPVIGVGGISSPDDARRMVDAGASLVQIYTGLIYRGPSLVRQVAGALEATDRPAREGALR